MQTQLAQEQKRIELLEIRISELNQLISEQQTKLGKDCLRFFNEEERQLIQELIQAHKDYLLAKKNRERVNNLFEKFYQVRQKIQKELGEETIELLEIVLTDYEELLNWESELTSEILKKELSEDKLNKVQVAIINCQTYNQIEGGINLKQGHLIMGDIQGETIDLSYNTNTYQTKLEELTEELLVTNIEQPPK